eukprot:5729999-Lingulodinium_polyedra.AAC.1
MECDVGHCAKTSLTAAGDDLIHGVVCIKYWRMEHQHVEYQHNIDAIKHCHLLTIVYHCVPTVR